jgi:hypothetical protein
MSFSGRRVSILRPAETRRFSATKDLSQNGMFVEYPYRSIDFSPLNIQ